MKGKRAFTLVELLVVIAIIALLMSILMPALTRARKQAKDVIDLSNLKQWASIFSMYTQDYDGYFNMGWQGMPDGSSNFWGDALRSYYKDQDICCCPTATKPYNEGGKIPFGAWWDYGGWLTPGSYGSYGINGWVEDNRGVEWGLNPNNRWRHCNVSGTDKIPLFLGNQWIDGWPQPYDEPPPYDGFPRGSVESNYMERFVMNRHEGRVAGLFMDMSVRMIGLKELWVLKWHRSYDQFYPVPTWPEWMEDFKDYAIAP
jgi:prepilin-type N-terminal cleavage/methylation domain-containing protein